MNRKFLVTSVLGLLLGHKLFSAENYIRPNILFIVSEDNAADLGCYGNEIVHTPNLDRLASEGMRFNNAYVTYSVSSPSRATILTGLYPHQNGQIGLATHAYAMYDDIKTLPSYMHELGYKCGNIGKIHVNPESKVGFDYWSNRGSNFGKKKLDSYAQRALEFIKSAKDEPFFLMVNYPDAHFPLQDRVEGLPTELVKADKITPLPYIRVDSDRHKSYVEKYYNCMNRLDEAIGILLKSLSDNNLLHNTVVIYMSDHGPQFPRAKCSNYEAGLRVPFIFRWPKKEFGGKVSNAFISSIDLLPTFIDLAGGEIPDNLPGQSLLPLLKGEQECGHKYIFAGGMGSAPFMHYPRRSVRGERYKLIVNYNSPQENPHYALYASQKGHFAGGISEEELASAPLDVQKTFLFWKKPPHYELYDLFVDPYELNNLAENASYKGVLQEMRHALSEWQRITNDPIRKRKLLKAINEEMRRVIIEKIDYKNVNFKWGYLDYFK